MTTQTSRVRSEKGFTLVYMAVGLTTMLLFTGLAIDSGRAYVVKAQLSKAVDGAALGAARMLNSGDPRGEAARIFQPNFPVGFMGTTSVTPVVAGVLHAADRRGQRPSTSSPSPPRPCCRRRSCGSGPSTRSP